MVGKMDVLTCAGCGAELPVGAMFCGECGRAVGSPKAARAKTSTAPAVLFEPHPL
ncbi:MAG: Double zinc ribbon, partial [Microbacteriaceae bacterium]|nr:Double zinc ribbon [Microbacteriaceae bacterium]